MSGKELVWLHGEIHAPPFSPEAKVEAGYYLRLLQEGTNLGLPQSRPLPDIGRNCHELRIKDKHHNWRIVYHLDKDAVVILGIFDKDTQKMPHAILISCQDRLKAYQAARSRRR